MIMNGKIIVGVIGAGTMGAGIAQVAATAGHPTFLTDANPEMLVKARESHAKSIAILIEKGKISKEKGESVRASIHYVENLSSLEKAGLVIEAIIEDLDAKQKLLTGLESIVSENCILASNTSSLSIASVASACSHPGRVLGIHFFNPAPLMPLVEIIPALTTNNSLVDEAKKLIEGWGKVVVVAKDTPGFIVNRIARPYYGESIRIYEEGIAGMATIDWALREAGGFRMGPFELMDFIGNDINYKVTETVWSQFFFDQRYKPSLTQKRLFEARLYGRKSGKGYYDYSPGAAKPEPVQDTEQAQKIFMRVFSMLVNEAADALYLRVASREDIDIAMTRGVNYPHGLLRWADQTGLDRVLQTLDALYNEYREDRYRASVLLRRMVQEGKMFYATPEATG
jgi:3-hydroxybutyryl-CoA dehydrogenase